MKEYTIGIDNLYGSEAESEEEAIEDIKEYIQNHPKDFMDNLILQVVGEAEKI